MRFLEAFIVALWITIVQKIVVLIWILTYFNSTRYILTIIGTVVAVSGRSECLGDFFIDLIALFKVLKGKKAYQELV